MITLINDFDHAVRLHLAKSIVILFTKSTSSTEQTKHFEEIKAELKNASVISVSIYFYVN